MESAKSQGTRRPEEPSSTRSTFRVVWDESPEQLPASTISRLLVPHAQALAREVQASAILVLADVVQNDDVLKNLFESTDCRTILVSRTREIDSIFRCLPPHIEWISVPNVHMTRTGQIKVALLISLANGKLSSGDRVVCLTGVDGANSLDTCLILSLETEPELFSTADLVLLSGGVSPAVFERTLTLATQLATEGREGRPIGALFVIGDSHTVLAQSTPLVLNPFHGYPESVRNILDPAVEETIKEFSAIDGAFIVRGDGVVLAAGTQLRPAKPGGQLPKGLGTRHAAACGITASSSAVAIVISHSTGTISIFRSGKLITDIHRPAVSARGRTERKVD